MSLFLDQQEIFNKPIRLSIQERIHPIIIFNEFFTDYHLSDLRHNLWEIVQACITSDNPYFDDPAKRADLFMFYERIEGLLEAAHIFHLRDKA